ncbi:TolC family protein [Novipirellula maiorica]|uniref:TolC family protein n=1 Tax=Novipirellula maiorica TaxID=1265734 RepID=UPI0003487BA1|nr:TolC family protein [Rhodopirellula maiorica]
MTKKSLNRTTTDPRNASAVRSTRWRRALLGVLIATTGGGNLTPVLAGNPTSPFFTASRIHGTVQTTTFADEAGNPGPYSNQPESVQAFAASAAMGGNSIVDERPVVYLSLAEARARVIDSNPELDSLSNALAAIAEEVTIADADFDGVVGVDIEGGKLDRQLSNSVATFGLPTRDLQTDYLRSLSGNMLSYSKRTRTGGEFLLGYDTGYNFLSPVGSDVLVNPAWDADLNFRFSQQLAQGRRRVINESPIQLARYAYMSLSAELRAEINTAFRDVELAYWEYAGRYAEYQVAEESTARFKELVDSERGRLEQRESTIVDVAQADELYQTARFNALELRRTAEVAAVELLRLMGDYRGRTIRLVPTDQPQVDLSLHFDEGMVQSGFRPEVEAQRTLVRAARLQILQARDLLRPDIRANFGYTQNGLENQLDDALETAFDGNYQDWFVGFEFRQSVGQRAAYARARQACRQLAAQQSQLDAIRRDIYAEVNAAAVEIELLHESLEIAEARVASATAQSDGRRQLYDTNKATIDLLLRNDQTLVDAQRASIQAIYAYQQAQTEWRFATGTIDRSALGLETTLDASLQSFEMIPSSVGESGNAGSELPTPSVPAEANAAEANAAEPQAAEAEAAEPTSDRDADAAPIQEAPPAPPAAKPKADDQAAISSEPFAPVVSHPYRPSWISGSAGAGPIESYPQVVVGKPPVKAISDESPSTPMQQATSSPRLMSPDQVEGWSEMFSAEPIGSAAARPETVDPAGFPEVVVAKRDGSQSKAQSEADALQAEIEARAAELLPEVHVSPLKFQR